MFDIGADELLLTAVVAIVVIGPKDLPRAMRVAGRWVAKMRRMSNAFRAGFENMVREAEMEEMEREWRERNAAIMVAHPTAEPVADVDAAGAAAAAQGHLPAPDYPAPGAAAPAPPPAPHPESDETPPAPAPVPPAAGST
jgi:sec-independent protein translocase protein TatB